MPAIILKSTEDLGAFSADATTGLTIHAEASGVLMSVSSPSEEIYTGSGWLGTPEIGGVAGTYVYDVDVGNQASAGIWYWTDISARSDDNLIFPGANAWTIDVGLLYVYAADLQLDGTQTWRSSCSTCSNTTLSANIVDPPAAPGNWIHLTALAGLGVIDVVHDLTEYVTETSGDNRHHGYNDSSVSEQGWEMVGIAFWTGAVGAVFYDASNDIVVSPDPVTVVLTAPTPVTTDDDNITEYDNQQFVKITVPEPVITVTYPTQVQTVGADSSSLIPGRVPLSVGLTSPILTEVNNVPEWKEEFVSTDVAHPQIVMAEDITDPPEPVWTEDGTDYVYEEQL